MRLRLIPLILFTILTCCWLVASQNAPDEVQVDPNAQCKQDTRDQITSCLDQVEQDESKLKTGPCSSSDWECICTKQQGMVDCYAECPGLQPVDMIKFNGNNCKGQHGQTIKSEGGDLTYTWSNLAFTSSSTEPPTVNSSTDSASTANNTTSSNVLGTNDQTSASTADASLKTDTQSASISSTVANATTASTNSMSTQPSSASSDTSVVSQNGAANVLSRSGGTISVGGFIIASLLALVTV